MIAIVLMVGSTVIDSWTVQGWVGDPEALVALANETGCTISVVPLAQIQPLESGDLVRRARARLAERDMASLVVTYTPGRPRDALDQEEYPL